MSTATATPNSPANPFARQVAVLRRTVVTFVTPERLERVLAAVLAKAEDGNLTAARLLLSYALGKPGPTVDPDRVDAHEWQVQKETATMLQEMPALLQAPDPELPLKAVRTTRPMVGREIARKLGAMLTEPEKYQDERVELEPVEDDGPPSPNGGNGDEAAWLAILAARQGMAAPSPNGPNGRK